MKSKPHPPKNWKDWKKKKETIPARQELEEEKSCWYLSWREPIKCWVSTFWGPYLPFPQQPWVSPWTVALRPQSWPLWWWRAPPSRRAVSRAALQSSLWAPSLFWPHVRPAGRSCRWLTQTAGMLWTLLSHMAQSFVSSFASSLSVGVLEGNFMMTLTASIKPR